jgi:hypothetical protein
MVVSRVDRVVNPRRTRPRTRSAGNPAHMLTLGFINPKRSSMARKAKKKSSAGHRRTKPRARIRKSNPHVIVRTRKAKAKGHRRRSKNPGRMSLFGGPMKPAKILELALGVGVGIGVNRAVVPMILPASMASNNLAATAFALGVAIAEWWLASMWDPNFGAAVGIGGIARAIDQGLNAVFPVVGSFTGLTGVRNRGTGDFVKASYTVPQNPITDGNPQGAPPQMMLRSPGAYQRRVA